MRQSQKSSTSQTVEEFFAPISKDVVARAIDLEKKLSEEMVTNPEIRACLCLRVALEEAIQLHMVLNHKNKLSQELERVCLRHLRSPELRRKMPGRNPGRPNSNKR